MKVIVFTKLYDKPTFTSHAVMTGKRPVSQVFIESATFQVKRTSHFTQVYSAIEYIKIIDGPLIIKLFDVVL